MKNTIPILTIINRILTFPFLYLCLIQIIDKEKNGPALLLSPVVGFYQVLTSLLLPFFWKKKKIIDQISLIVYYLLVFIYFSSIYVPFAWKSKFESDVLITNLLAGLPIYLSVYFTLILEKINKRV